MGRSVSARANEPYEVRVRVAGRTDNLREAVRIGNEVETLYTNGPAGGGGASKSARDVVAVASVLLPRELAQAAGAVRRRIITMKLREIAHSRTGDKGNISNISVIAYDAKDLSAAARPGDASAR